MIFIMMWYNFWKMGPQQMGIFFVLVKFFIA